MNNFAAMLRGGDRRSIGKAEEAAQRVADEPALFADLFECLFDADAVVRMRAADAAEKATRERPELLQAWKRPLMEVASASKDKEVRWHIAQVLPRLRLTAPERDAAVQILTHYLDDGSSIVRTFSMQALADLADQEESLKDQVVAVIERLTQVGTPAMRSRGRMLLKRFRGLSQ